MFSLNVKLYTSCVLKAWFTLTSRDVRFCFILKLSRPISCMTFFCEECFSSLPEASFKHLSSKNSGFHTETYHSLIFRREVEAITIYRFIRLHCLFNAGFSQLNENLNLPNYW